MVIFIRKESWNLKSGMERRDKEKSCAKEENCNSVPHKVCVKSGSTLELTLELWSYRQQWNLASVYVLRPA